MLHIRCGDDIIKKIMNARLPGRAITWAEPLCDGPVTNEDLSQIRDQRIEFISKRYGLKTKFVKKGLDKQDKTLQTAARHEEIVLWIEADLYDQLILCYLVQELKKICAEDVKISLICKYVKNGLSSLETEDLGKLFDQRHILTLDEINSLAKVWSAYTSSDPTILSQLLASDQIPETFSYLKSGLARHLEDVFWSTDGLSKTERFILQSVKSNVQSPLTIYKNWSIEEKSAWLPDALFFAYIFELVAAETPLLSSTTGKTAEDLKLSLTEAGEKILAGEIHRKDLWKNMSRFRGGLEIADANGPKLFWDPEVQKLVAA